MDGSVNHKYRSTAPHRLILIFILFSLLVITAGYFYLKNEEKFAILKSKQEIATIADLYVTQIANWRLERMSNARAIHSVPLLPSLLKNCTENPKNRKLLDEYTVALDTLRDAYKLESIVALDTRLNIVCSSGKRPDFSSEQSGKNIKEALNNNNIIFSDMHRDEPDAEIHMDIYLPMLLKTSGKNTCVGLMIIRVDPNVFLYPLLRTWPVPSRTAETVLVSRQGDEVVFLNELRHQKNTALNLKLPVSRKNLAAAMAVRGIEDTVEAVDYRGKPVIAVLRKIPESPWFLIAKTDKEEIYGPIHNGQITLAALILVFTRILQMELNIYFDKTLFIVYNIGNNRRKKETPNG